MAHSNAQSRNQGVIQDLFLSITSHIKFINIFVTFLQNITLSIKVFSHHTVIISYVNYCFYSFPHQSSPP